MLIVPVNEYIWSLIITVMSPGLELSYWVHVYQAESIKSKWYELKNLAATEW